MTTSLELAQLVACGFHPTQARTFLDPLFAACLRFEINTPARMAGFFAQLLVESSGLTCLEEDLFYTTPARVCALWPTRISTTGDAVPLLRNPKALANRVYSLKNGNGDEASGDGWRYRGRGGFQITGRHNYADVSQALGLDYVANPDALATPTDAALSAAWFWHVNKGNIFADALNWDACTRSINGPAMVDRMRRAQQSADNLHALTP